MKRKYNEGLKRLNKAMKYLDNTNIPIEQREKHIGAFKKLLHNQNIMMDKLNLKSGDKEVLNGFEEV